MDSLISVIVPIYKVEEYLPRCLDSIVNQTYRNLEIILVDDGSPDNCGMICDRYAERDVRIRVIHQENAGLSGARNVGLDVMTGEYLTFVDSDDWLAPNAIEVLYDRMQQDGSDMVIGQMVKVFDDGYTKPSYCAWIRDMKITGQEALAMLGTQTPIPCYAWGSLIHKSVYKNLRFTKMSRAEDVWILPDVLDACGTISLDSRIMYYYYQRATSIVHKSTDQQWLDSAAAAFHVSRFLLTRGLPENAAVYGIDGLRQLQQVQNIKKAKQLAADAFSRKEWLQIVKCRPMCLCYGLCLYIPRTYKALRKLWRRVRYKE